MPARSAKHRVTRRQILKTAAIGMVTAGAARPSLAETASERPDTVRDRLWVFTCAANSDFTHVGRRSMMTPVESAFYLDVPNVIVVQSSVDEAPHGRLQPPFAQHAIAMEPLKRMVWSVVGSGGFTAPEETREVFELARTQPNFAGIFLDDYFIWHRDKDKKTPLSVEQLAEMRGRLKQIDKKLDVFTTLYVTELDFPIRDHLTLVDVITLWTWKPEDLVHLEANMKKLEKQAPNARKMLGCYLVDYDKKQGTPLDAMQRQCETGVRWLKEGRIEGLVFLGNTVMDLGFESVGWTRKWIQRVMHDKLST
jgi:hypothetical protein